MSKNFASHRGHNNACPVCSSTSGKCKEQEYDLPARNGKTTPSIKTFCMDGTGGNGHPNYHYFGDTSDGTWGIYIPLVDWDEHRGQSTETTYLEKEEWIRQQEAKRQAALEAENQQKANTFSVAERDPVARQILAQLSLHDVDRKDLLRRGFTPQQIKEIGFKSIDPFQRLREPVDPRFPGVNVEGTRLNNGYMGGILIPVYTITGEIVAFQIRNREKNTDGRYRWLSSSWEKERENGSSPKLADLKLPLTHVYPQLLGAEARSEAVGLMEGTGAKPNIGAVKTGEQVIGAAGGQFLGSSVQLKTTLQTWNAIIVKLYLDGDDIYKPQVIKRWVKIYHQLIEWGYIPKIVWSGKDIDELDDLSELRELSLDELAELTKIELPTAVDTKVTPSRRSYQESKRFTPDETQCNRFLSLDVSKINFENLILAVKSALGTGKTELLIAIANLIKPLGLELLILGYRNNLLYQTCDRVPDLYHIGEENKIMLSSDYHKAICHHSAGLIDPSSMSNKIIVIDECASVLDDMTTSKLTGGRNKDGTDSRQKRLEHIEQLIANAHGIVTLDGHLTDRHVNFLHSIRPADRVQKIENTYKNHMNIRMTKDKSRTIREVIDLALADDKPILVTCSTQVQCENFERKLIRAGIEPKDIHRFDGKTDRDESVRLFFRDPKAYLESYQPRIVLMSPTCETGISIDFPDYFGVQYHFHMGNLGITSGLQFLVRYRDLSTPRVIYCEEQGILDKNNSSSLARYVKDEFNQKIEIDLNLLAELLDENRVEEAKNFLAAHQQNDEKWHKLAYETKANLSEEMKYLQEIYIEALRADGNTVIVEGEEIEGCDDTQNLMTRVEVERRVTHSTQLHGAAKISKEEYEKIRNNPNANESDRLKAAKHHFTERQFPGIENSPSWSPELVQMVKYNKRTLPKELENYHYLINPELANINHIAVWEPVISTKSIWLPDQINRSQLALVKAGRELNLHNLGNTVITNNEITEFVNKIYESKRYQTIFNIKFDPEKVPDNLQLFRRIVKNFAFKVNKLNDESYKIEATIDKNLMFQGAPKYELLTPELSERIRQLVGQELSKDSKLSKELNAEFKRIGIKDPEGSMNTINGAARYLGLSVEAHRRIKLDANGEKTKKYNRTYTYTDEHLPISDAIKKSNIYPGTHEIVVKDIYDCIVTRMTNLNKYQLQMLEDWKNSRIPTIAEIHQGKITDNFNNSVLNIELPARAIGNLEFSIENLRSLAETLLETAQLKVAEIKEVFDSYLTTIDAMVIQFAGEILKIKYPEMFNRIEPYFEIPF